MGAQDAAPDTAGAPGGSGAEEGCFFVKDMKPRGQGWPGLAFSLSSRARPSSAPPTSHRRFGKSRGPEPHSLGRRCLPSFTGARSCRDGASAHFSWLGLGGALSHSRLWICRVSLGAGLFRESQKQLHQERTENRCSLGSTCESTDSGCDGHGPPRRPGTLAGPGGSLLPRWVCAGGWRGTCPSSRGGRGSQDLLGAALCLAWWRGAQSHLCRHPSPREVRGLGDDRFVHLQICLSPCSVPVYPPGRQDAALSR